MDSDGSLEQRSLSEKKGFRARWKKSKSRKGNLSRKAKSKKSKWSRSAKSKKSKLSRRAKGGRAKLSGSSKESKGSSSKSVKSTKSSKDTSKSKSSRLSCLSCKRKKQKDLNSRSSAGSAEYRLSYASLRDEFNKKRVDGPFKQDPNKQLKDSRSTMGSTDEGVPPICSREPGKEDFNRKTREGKIPSQDSNSKSDERSSRSSKESGDKKRKKEKSSSSGKKKRKNPLAFLFKGKKERKESKEPSEPESRSASGADDAAGGPARGSPPSTKSSSQRFSKEGPSSAETDSQKVLKEGSSSVGTKSQKVLRGDRPPTKESDSQKLVKGSPPSAKTDKTDSQRAIRETRRTAKETKSQRLAREGPPPTKSESRNVRECPSSAKTNSQRMEALEKAERDIEKDIMEIAEERRKIWQFWHNAHLVPLTQFLLTVPPLAWAYFALVVCLVVKIIFVCFIFSMLVHSYDAPLVYLMCFMIIHIGSAFATVQVLAVGTKRMVMICGSVDGAVILVSVLLLMFISKDKNGPGIVDVERVGGTTVAVAFLELLLLLNYYHYHFRAPQTREEDPPGLPSIRSYSCTRTSRTTNVPSMSLTQQDLSPRQQPRHPRGHRHHHHRPGHERVRDISLSGQQDSDMVKTLPPPHYSFLEYSGTDSRPHRYVRDHRSGEIRDIRHTSV